MFRQHFKCVEPPFKTIKLLGRLIDDAQALETSDYQTLTEFTTQAVKVDFAMTQKQVTFAARDSETSGFPSTPYFQPSNDEAGESAYQPNKRQCTREFVFDQRCAEVISLPMPSPGLEAPAHKQPATRFDIIID